jgi:hypothetical protein
MSMQGSMCLDEMLPLELQMPEVLVLDTFLNFTVVCSYICLCWNKNEDSRGWYAWKRVGGRGPTFVFNTMLVGEVRLLLILSSGRCEWWAPRPDFFYFNRGQGVIKGLGDPIFFLDCVIHCLSYSRPTLCVYDRSYFVSQTDSENKQNEKK